MFEKKISKEMLKCIGILEVSQLDLQRFIDRFKINNLPLSRKLILYVSIPAFRKFLDIKLEGVLKDEE
tara:strand:- start:829 stop:1032 length:204 start_codon:yes stop_codon:yes gene_type:complete